MIDFSKVECLPEMRILVADVKVKYRNIGPFSVKVWKTANPDYPYQGESEYSFWGPKQCGPYRAIHSEETIEDAINNALLYGFKEYDDIDRFSDEEVFFGKEECGQRVFMDGNGTVVSEEEVRKKLDECRKNNQITF